MPGTLDRLIAWASPETALRRHVARRKLEILDSGYSQHGASRTKPSLAGWYASSRSPDDDITRNLPDLRERSRDLFMGVPMATGALKTVRTNVVGAGLQMKCRLDAGLLGMTEDRKEEWEATAEREFAYWCEREADAAGIWTFGQIQSLALLSMLMSGDVFALLPMVESGGVYSLRVRLIEADRVCNPLGRPETQDLSGGVETGENGAVLAYHVCSGFPKSSTDWTAATWARVEPRGSLSGRRQIVHLFQDPERPEQRRGVPFLAPVIESLKQLGRYSDAELMAAVVSGMYTVFIKSAAPDVAPGEAGRGWAGAQAPEDAASPQPEPEQTVSLGNGAVVSLAEGEDISLANPTRPNANFDGFVNAVARQIGSALEIPYEVLVKQWTASYSASRAAFLEAWKMFRMRRAWTASGFCQPIYEEWLAEAVALGRIDAPGFLADPFVRWAYSRADWIGPSPGQVDPLKEVEAAKTRIDEGLSTRERETAELTGGDWEENHIQRVKEERMRSEGGLKGGIDSAGEGAKQGRQTVLDPDDPE